jgi:tetratricopeptide (TPR) repeat protein
MKVTRSISAVRTDPPRLAPMVQILGFGFAVGLALFAAFNSQNLVQRMTTSNGNDAISLAYLRIWIRAKPDEYHLRLVLARHEFLQGNLKRAEDAITPILKADDVDHIDLIDAQLLMLDIRKQELWRLKPNTESYIQAHAQYLKQLRQVTRYPWDFVHQKNFAQTAISSGDVKLSYELYSKLIKKHPCYNLKWYEIIAQINLSRAHYSDAANSYFLASACSKNLIDKRTNIITGLQALQSGNRMNEAMLASENHFDILQSDPEALQFLAKLALASNRPDLAEKYVSRLLQQRISTIKGSKE